MCTAVILVGMDYNLRRLETAGLGPYLKEERLYSYRQEKVRSLLVRQEVQKEIMVWDTSQYKLLTEDQVTLA